MRRTKEEAEQTKEAIFQAGIRLFSENGIHETSMTDIAREAGVTRGAIYWHFENKEALLREIRGRLHVFYKSLVDDINAESVPLAESIGKAVRTLFQRYKTDEEYRRLQDLQIHISILYAENKSIIKELAEQERDAFQDFCYAIEEDAHSACRDPSTLFTIMEAFVGGLLILQYMRNTTLTDDEINAAAGFLEREFKYSGAAT